MDYGYGTTGCLLDAVFGASYMQALHENLSMALFGRLSRANIFNASLKSIA